MAEHTTAAHTSRLTELRRLDSADKARRVLAALDATISAGEPLTIAALARRAGVSRRFVYDHPELRAEAERRASSTPPPQRRRVRQASVTTASLRADLANAKAANHRLHTELQPCADVSDALSAKTPSRRSPVTKRQPSPPSQRRGVAELEHALFEAHEALAQRTEDLEAARRINRELLERLNRRARS